jgi:hypothetical protein
MLAELHVHHHLTNHQWFINSLAKDAIQFNACNGNKVEGEWRIPDKKFVARASSDIDSSIVYLAISSALYLSFAQSTSKEL